MDVFNKLTDLLQSSWYWLLPMTCVLFFVFAGIGLSIEINRGN